MLFTFQTSAQSIFDFFYVNVSYFRIFICSDAFGRDRDGSNRKKKSDLLSEGLSSARPPPKKSDETSVIITVNDVVTMEVSWIWQ